MNGDGMDTETVVRLQNLQYKVGNRFLLHNVNWEIRRGENWILFGLNGSGKTTLLSIIAGFSGYSSGTVQVFGEQYGEETTIALRKKIGFISSSFFEKIYRKENALNIVLSGCCGGLGVNAGIRNRDVMRAKDLLAQLAVADKAAQPFCELSKGERQRVLIARALISDPPLLILDEPCTGLDVAGREQMLDIVRRLAQENVTILYVTHYLEEILKGFDHCLLLRQGRVYRSGETEALLTEAVLSDFLGFPVKMWQSFGTYYLKMKDGRGEDDDIERGNL